MLSRARGAVVALVIVGGGGLMASSANAEVVAGQPDETIQQAYPIAEGHSYSGAFDNTNYDDADYLAFTVSRANQTLEFTVANTTSNCADPNDAGCPVYATLMDSSDQQLGGDSSDAGTIATNGDTEVLDWTFTAPGTYYLLMESNGDESPGNPSYTVSYATGSPPGTGGGTGPPPPPLIRSFKAAPRQHGATVTASVVLGRPATRLTATLVTVRSGRRPKTVARWTRTNLFGGSHRLRLRLSAPYRALLKRRHRLSLRLDLVGRSNLGIGAASRRVLLLAP